MLKRGVKSPDRGDAAVQSFYELASVPAASTVLRSNTEQTSGSLTSDLLNMRT
jgi:hypothetical protein